MFFAITSIPPYRLARSTTVSIKIIRTALGICTRIVEHLATIALLVSSAAPPLHERSGRAPLGRNGEGQIRETK